MNKPETLNSYCDRRRLGSLLFWTNDVVFLRITQLQIQIRRASNYEIESQKLLGLKHLRLSERTQFVGFLTFQGLMYCRDIWSLTGHSTSSARFNKKSKSSLTTFFLPPSSPRPPFPWVPYPLSFFPASNRIAKHRNSEALRALLRRCSTCFSSQT